MASHSQDHDVRPDAADADGASQRSDAGCPICMALLVNQRVGTPECCDHSFCLPCIREWAKSVNTCPIDRRPFNEIKCRLNVKNDTYFKTIYVKNRKLPSPDDPTYCEVCKRCNLEHELLLCDGCDRGYHLRCFDPPLNAVPNGEWYCTRCLRIKTTGMRSLKALVSASSRPSSSTDSGGLHDGRRSCRSGLRKEYATTAVPGLLRQQTKGRRTFGRRKVALTQHMVPEASFFNDETNDSGERADASDKDSDSEISSSDDSTVDDDDSDEDYEPSSRPKSVKSSRMRRPSSNSKRVVRKTRLARNGNSRSKLANSRRGSGRNSLGPVKPVGRRRRLANLKSHTNPKKNEGKKAKKSGTASLAKEPRVVLRPLQPSPVSHASPSSRRSDNINEGSTVSIDHAPQTGSSCRVHSITVTETSDNAVAGRSSYLRVSTERNESGCASGHARRSDDAMSASFCNSQECPYLHPESDVPPMPDSRPAHSELVTLSSPPQLPMGHFTVKVSKRPSSRSKGGEHRPSTTVNRFSRSGKTDENSTRGRSGSGSTKTVALSATSNIAGHSAEECSVLKKKKTVDVSGQKSRCKSERPFVVSCPLRTGSLNGTGSVREASDQSAAANSGSSVFVIRDDSDVCNEVAEAGQKAYSTVTIEQFKRCEKISSEVSRRPSKSAKDVGYILVSTHPGSANGDSLSGTSPCTSQQNSIAPAPCVFGAIESAVAASELGNECSERVPILLHERISSNTSSGAEIAANDVMINMPTLDATARISGATACSSTLLVSSRVESCAESRRPGLSNSPNDEKILSNSSPSATARSCELFSGCAAITAEGAVQSAVVVDGGGSAVTDGRSTVTDGRSAVTDGDCTFSRRRVATGDSASAETSRKRLQVSRRARRGPRTPSPPPPPSSDDDNRSRSPVLHRQWPSSPLRGDVEQSVGGTADVERDLASQNVTDNSTVRSASEATAELKCFPAIRAQFAGRTAFERQQSDDNSTVAATVLKQCTEIDSQKECVRPIEASSVSKPPMQSAVVRETLICQRIYQGSHRNDQDRDFLARHRAEETRYNSSLGQLSHPVRSYSADDSAGGSAEQHVHEEDPGPLHSRCPGRQYEYITHHNIPDNFNGPLLPHSEVRAFLKSTVGRGHHRPPLLPDPVPPATVGRRPSVDSRASASRSNWRAKRDAKMGFESEEWAAEGGYFECESFDVTRSEVYSEGGEHNYGGNGNYCGDNEDYYDGNEEYFDGNEEYFDGNEEYFDGNVEYFDGNEEYFDGDEEYFDGNQEYYDGSECYGNAATEMYTGHEAYNERGYEGYEHMTNDEYFAHGRFYNLGEPYCRSASKMDPRAIGKRGRQSSARGGMSTRPTARSSWERQRVDDSDFGADKARYGTAGSFGWSMSGAVLPSPSGNVGLYNRRGANPNSVHHSASALPQSKQWLADCLRMENMHALMAAPRSSSTACGRGSRGSSHLAADYKSGSAMPINSRGQSVRDDVLRHLHQRDSRAVSSCSGSRGLLDQPLNLPLASLTNVVASIGEQQLQSVPQSGDISLPHDPRVHLDEITDRTPAVSTAAVNAHPPSSVPAGSKDSPSQFTTEAKGRDSNSGSVATAVVAGISEATGDVGGGSPMSISSQGSCSLPASPDRSSLASVLLSRTPSPSAFASGNNRSLCSGNAASNEPVPIVSVTGGSTAAVRIDEAVAAVQGCAAESSSPVAAATSGTATSVSSFTPFLSSSTLKTAGANSAKTEDLKLSEIAAIVERHLMVAYMAGRINNVTYKEIARKAVSKIYKQEKGSKLDERRIQKLVEAYVREADFPDLRRVK